jgi:drug/metabolite transporter (DMT)-like permease
MRVILPAPAPSGPDLKALLLAPVGAVMIGTVPYLAVELFREGVDTRSLLFWRYVFALSLLLPLVLALRQPLRTAWRAGGRSLFLNSLTLGSFQTFCYFQSVERIPTSVAILFFYTYPLFALVLQRLLHARRASRQTAVACVMIVAGAGAMAVGSLPLAFSSPLGMFLAAIVPLSYGFYILLLARAAGKVPALSGATFIQLGLFTSYSLMALFFGVEAGSDMGGWLRIVAVATLGSALPMLIMAYALPRLGAAGFGIMSSLELVTVVVLGVLLLGESLSPGQWAGIGLVLAGILIYRPAADRDAQAKP